MKKISIPGLFKTKSFILLFLSLTSTAKIFAQQDTVAGIPVNYDESKTGSYTLPDPLTLQNGADEITYGIRGHFLEEDETWPKPDEWGTISAWAWGLGYVMDYLETNADVDAKKVALNVLIEF